MSLLVVQKPDVALTATATSTEKNFAMLEDCHETLATLGLARCRSKHG